MPERRESALQALKGISRDAKGARTSKEDDDRPGLMILIGLGEEEEEEEKRRE